MLLRFAGLTNSRYGVSLDGRRLGIVDLPATGGWGNQTREWQTGSISLTAALASGQHTLEILADRESKPINLDWLAFVPREPASIKPLVFQPEDASTAGKPIQLPPWSPAEKAGPGEAFLLDPKQITQQIWGRGLGQATHYSDEYLPGLFEPATLVLEEMKLGGGKLEWVFTGDVGGVTVALSDSLLEVSERFYDSEGFRQIEGSPRGKHPEFVAKSHRIAFEGRTAGVTVAMDHKLQFRVSLNGREVLCTLCSIDLTKHQIRLNGKDGLVRGGVCVRRPCRASVAVDPAIGIRR